MKNLSLIPTLALPLLIGIVANTTLQAQNVVIPDANFKALLVGNISINTDGDDEISVSEAAAFTGEINGNSKGIANLTGIEAFTALTVLRCGMNQITTLNVSSNTALTGLYCWNNELTALDISSNNALEILWCDNNQLTALDVSSNTALTELSCLSNQLTALDVSNNIALIELDCPNNQFTVLDVSNNTALKNLFCAYNQLTELDVSSNIALEILDCTDNQLTSLNVKNGNNPNFSWFRAQNNPLLMCIEVDDATYSNDNWIGMGGSFMKDPEASYKTECLSPPSPPSASASQVFCSGAIIADLVADAGIGNSVLWYASASGGTALADNEVLASKNYYVATIRLSDYVLSNTRTHVTVTVSDIPAIPVITPDFSNTASRKLSVESLAAASYAWFFNGTAYGEDAAEITITEEGIYTVAITVNDCTSPMSDAFEFIITGIEDVLLEACKPYPNPVNNTLTIDLSKIVHFEKSLNIRLITTNGEQVFSKSFISPQDLNVELDMSSYGSGIYIAELISTDKKLQYKILKYNGR